MKTMVVSDFAMMRVSFLQMMGIILVVGIVMGVFMGTVTGAVAAVTVMAPFICLFSISASDEQNGWESFRLTLPLSRRRVVFGRYASLGLITLFSGAFAMLIGVVMMLIGNAFAVGSGAQPALAALSSENNPPAIVLSVVLVACAMVLVASSAVLPLIMRFGMTRAARFVPLLVVLALAAGIGYLDTVAAGAWEGVYGWFSNVVSDDAGAVLLASGALLVAVAVFAATAPLSVKLYEHREF